jgi:hypothetical protein
MRNAFFAVFALLSALPVLVSAQPPKKTEDLGPASTEAEFERQYQERIKKDILNGVYIPKNLDDAMSQLDRITSPESQAKFKALPEDSVCLVMHHRLGQWIILNWGFYGGSRLSHYLRSAGVTYPDDMADFVMLAYHRRLNGKPYTVKEFAVRFREQRKKEFEAEKKQGKVLHEEVRKRKDKD